MEQNYSEFIKMIHEFKRTTGKVRTSSLTWGEFMTLLVIQHLCCESKEKGIDSGVKVGMIAKKLETSKPDVSKKIRLLEEKKLVKRYEGTDDKRVTYIQITDCGIEILRANKEEADRFLNCVFQRMGEKEMLDFMALCHRMREAMEEEIAVRKKGKGENEKNI